MTDAGPGRSIDWFMLPGQRPWRELHWLGLMPGTTVRSVGSPRPPEAADHVELPYRQPTTRFVEAGAFAWLRGVHALGGRPDWAASLELCSLVSGQAAASARRRGTRHAVLVWANDPDSPLYRLPPYSLATRRSLRADLFLCFVEAARDHLLALGAPADRCHVVHPGIDLTVFHPRDEQGRALAMEPVVAFVSPIAPNKGIDRVLDAFEHVRRRVPDARLVVAGRGPLVDLVRRAEASTDGAVTYAEHLDRGGVAELLRNSRVFVTAPRANRVWNEQFGLAYVEAMACGLPVVTTVCGSNGEAVQAPNVRVDDDAEALAEALVAFLTDDGLRRDVGRHNIAHVRTHHDVVTQAAAMGEVFSRAEAS